MRFSYQSLEGFLNRGQTIFNEQRIFFEKLFKKSIQNHRYLGPSLGVNKSVCEKTCESYLFSTNPSRNDLPLMRTFLLDEIMKPEEYQMSLFHADAWYDFGKKDFGLLLKSAIRENIDI